MPKEQAATGVFNSIFEITGKTQRTQAQCNTEQVLKKYTAQACTCESAF